MKKLITAVLLSVGLAGTAFADPIEGTWKTEPADGIYYHVQMKQCGSSFCGIFKKKFENGKEVSSPVIGRNAIFDMLPDGKGKYAGKAYSPSKDKVFKGKGELKDNNTLSMAGCVLAIICQTATWKRLN